MKIKVSVVLLTFMLLMSLPMNVLAGGNNQANSTLSSYLLATQKGDINQMVVLSNDSRVSPNASAVEFYTQIINNQSEQLASYEILTQEVLSPTSSKFITVLTFKNGDSSQVPFTLSYDKGHWKVMLTPNSLEDSKYKVIKGENLVSGSGITPTASVTTVPRLGSQALTSLCSWSFTELANTMYSINSFSINSVYSQALVQGGQGPTDVLSGYVPTIRYAVVQPHFYGDTVWGATDCYGSGTYSFLINGSSLAFSNAKMRFSLIGAGQTSKANGDGNIYNN